MKYHELAMEIEKRLSKLIFVEAIFINGSVIAGTETPNSDIDFTVLVKNRNKDTEKVVKVLSKFIPFDCIEHEVHHFNYEKKRVAFTILGTKDMNFISNKLFDSKDILLKFQNVVQHKIIEAKEVYDPKNFLGLYKARVSDYPEKIRKEVIKNTLKELSKIHKEWEDDGFRNSFNFVFNLPEVLEKICIVLYAKNKRFLMLPFKRLHKDLKTLKPNLEKEMYFLVDRPNTKQNIEKKIKILSRIILKLKNF